MTAGEWAATLCRRWYVMLGVLLCTVGVVFAVQGRSITYRGCDQLFLGAPPLPWNKNVLTGENASVAMTTGMVTEMMNSEQVRGQIAAAGYPSYYNMLMTNTGESRFPSYTSPTLHICVSSASKQAVLGTNAVASQKFITLLADMQNARHVPVKSRITVTRLASAAPLRSSAGRHRPTSVSAGRVAGRSGPGPVERPGAHPLAAAPQAPGGDGS